MSENGAHFKFSIGIGTITILLAAIAYFVYGNNIAASLAIVILIILCGICNILSLIPFLGVFAQRYVMSNWIFPWTFGLTHITTTWITSLIFYGYLVIGSIITIIMSLVALIVIVFIIIEIIV